MKTKKINLTEYTREELENQFVKLSTQVEELSAKIAWYEEQYRLSREKKFGASIEKQLRNNFLSLTKLKSRTCSFSYRT